MLATITGRRSRPAWQPASPLHAPSDHLSQPEARALAQAVGGAFVWDDAKVVRTGFFWMRGLEKGRSERSLTVAAYPALPTHASRLHIPTEAARTLGWHLHVVEVRRANEVDTAFAGLPRAAGVDAVLVLQDAVVLKSARGCVVAALAATHRLPVLYAWREWGSGGMPHVLWTEPTLDIPVGRHRRGQNVARRPSRRAAGGAGSQVRVGLQPQDRAGPRDHDAPLPAPLSR